MGINFPNSPTVGQTYPSPPVAGQPVYQWDGTAWVARPRSARPGRPGPAAAVQPAARDRPVQALLARLVQPGRRAWGRPVTGLGTGPPTANARGCGERSPPWWRSAS